MKLSQFEIGYLAGMIDAECHIGIQRDSSDTRRKTPSYIPRFELAMTDKKVIEYVNALLPQSKTVSVSAKGRRLPYYRVRLTTRQAIDFIRFMQPHLVGKKEQAALILKLDDLRRSVTPSKQHIGKPTFQRLPDWFVKEADKIFQEFRKHQLNKKPRKK